MRGNLDLIKEHRRQEFFELWSRYRAKGAVKFGLKVTTLFSIGVLVPVLVIQFFEDQFPDRKTLLVRWISSVIGGVILSAISWWTNEAKYKNILINNRLRAREKAIESETRSPIEPGGSATQ